MNRNFALEFVRVSETAALAASKLIGRGNEHAADQAAVEAMRKAFDNIDFCGVVKIGEGERDNAPMLYIGEQVGAFSKGKCFDLAVDPLEGTTICATGRPNSLSVIAVAEEGNLLHAPDTYMKKIAVGKQAKGVINLQASVEDNLKAIARAKSCLVEELTVVILDRKRHEDLICQVRSAGARISLISDGDVQAAVATALPNTKIDVLMGVGGAPEGVIAAAALRCLGGDFQGQLQFRNDEEMLRATKMGIKDFNRIYLHEELANGDVIFCATGVTDGSMLKGVRFDSKGASTHSVVMRSQTGTIRFIEAIHEFERKQKYSYT